MNIFQRYLDTLAGKPMDSIPRRLILMPYAVPYCEKHPLEDANEVYDAEAGNPFIVNAGCEIPSEPPLENLRALGASLSWKSSLRHF
jgi:uroporphyrinogen-III decarboxylase